MAPPEDGRRLVPVVEQNRRALERAPRGQADVERALTIARWTDTRFLDPVLGLVLPGVGDVVGAAAGLYIVVVGIRHGIPSTVVARMLFNLAVDCVGGAIPLVGDLFDMVNRANSRNARLLQQHVGGEVDSRPAAGRRRSLALSVLMLAGAVAVAIGVAYLLVSRWPPSSWWS